MTWFLLALAAVSALAPLIGADTRDGRDWCATAPFPPFPVPRRSRRFRTNGSRAPVPADRGRAVPHHPASAAG